jgi:hypothetical protein
MMYPQTATFYTNMGIEATRRNGAGNAWRLWVIGKALDTQGLGKVRRKELRAYLLQIGASPRQWQRWINQARADGFISDVQDRAGVWWVILPSAGKIAALMGCESAGRKVTIEAAQLIGKGWKARVYTAWEDGKQISRERIQKTVNIPVRTQVYRASQMGEEYKRTRNYSRSALTADKLQIVKELSSYKAPFVSRGVIYWRLPDMRQSANVLVSVRGRARKINKFIRSQADPKGLSNMRRAFTARKPGEWVRLFNHGEAQLNQSVRRIAKSDRRVSELYQRDHETKRGAVVWQHCPMR